MIRIVFEYVEMYNFRVHEHMRFDFTPNRFVSIVGDNGQGKTTILDAVCWAVYDETAKGRKGDAVLRKRSPKNTFVELKFTIGDDFYIIRNYRKHSEGKSEKILYKNGTEKEHDISGHGRADTNMILEQLLMPLKVFKNCLLFSQLVGDKSFSESTHGKQSELLDIMLDVSKYKDYHKITGTEITKTQSEIEKIAQEISGFEYNVGTINTLIQKEIDAKIQKDVAYEQRKGQYAFNISEIETKLIELQPTSTHLTALESEVPLLNTEVSQLTERLVNMQNATDQQLRTLNESYSEKFKSQSEKVKSDQEKNLSDIEAQIVDLNNQLKTVNQTQRTKHSELDTYKLTRINETNAEAEPGIKQQEALISNIDPEITKGNSLLESTTLKLVELEANIQKEEAGLLGDDSTCYACGQSLVEAAKVKIRESIALKKQQHETGETERQRIITELEKLIDNRANVKTQLDELQSKLSVECQKIDTGYIKAKDKIDTNHTDELSRLNALMKPLTESKQKCYDSIDDTLESLRTQLNKDGMHESANIKDQHEENSKELTVTVGLKQAEFKSKSKLLDELRIKYTSLMESSTKADVYREELALLTPAYQEGIKVSDANLADFQKQLDELTLNKNESLTKIKILNRKITIFEFWRKAWSNTGIKSILMDEAIPILNERAHELSSLTECIRVRYDAQTQKADGDLSNKFSVEVIQTKNLTDNRMDFSAGEGKLVDLITLMSLRYLLERMHGISFNIFLFDEILDNLDLGNVEIVLRMIRGISDENCVVLISHTLRDYIESDECLQL